MEISPKYCIVSASLFAAAFALKCWAARLFGSWQEYFPNGDPWPPPAPKSARPYRRQKTFSKRRPKAATYLCRFAAKARFDNRLPRVRFPKGRAAALPFGRFKGKRFLRKGGNRNPPFLKWRSLVTFFRQGKKVTRRRHPAPGRGTPRSTQKSTPPGAFLLSFILNNASPAPPAAA